MYYYRGTASLHHAKKHREETAKILCTCYCEKVGKKNKQTKRKTSYLACYQPSSAAASYSFFFTGQKFTKM